MGGLGNFLALLIQKSNLDTGSLFRRKSAWYWKDKVSSKLIPMSLYDLQLDLGLDVWGTEMIEFLAALAILNQDDF